MLEQEKADSIELSIILPAYNSVKVLEKAIDAIKKQVAPLVSRYEIIIAEDGSTDGTGALAREIAAREPCVIHSHHDKKLGKGGGLAEGFKLASGGIGLFIDPDLEIPATYIPKLLEEIRGGYDIASASKNHPQSRVRSPFKRRVLSRGANFLIRAVLCSKLYDHQTGLKAFKKEVYHRIFPHVKNKKWFWDTEVLMLAQWLGYACKEIPISISYGFGDTAVSSLKDSLDEFRAIFDLRLRKKRIVALIKEQAEKNAINPSVVPRRNEA
jgi:glycosyltransferase involved in cell wall biosynthesis